MARNVSETITLEEFYKRSEIQRLYPVYDERDGIVWDLVADAPTPNAKLIRVVGLEKEPRMVLDNG